MTLAGIRTDADSFVRLHQYPLATQSYITVTVS